jgi:hypothetical protein
MARNDIPAPERMLELSPGLAIYRVHLDRLRERDVNARVMAPDKFSRLAANIEKEKALESLPLVAVIPTEPEYFAILSGHHRTRAARTAQIMMIWVIVIERELTEDEITAKQLAHNSLEGHDDLDLLRQLYDSMQTTEAKLESGLDEMDLAIHVGAWPSESLDVEFDFEPIYVLFMDSHLKRWEHLIERLEPDARFYAANHEDFTRFVDDVKRIGKLKNIRNIAGIMVAFMEYAERGMAAAAEESAAQTLLQKELAK